MRRLHLASAIVFATTVLGGLAACASRPAPVADAPTVDWQRYLGTWYELARYDHRFERGLQAVTATYSMRDDGRIRVVNAGHRGSPQGERREAEAVAKIVSGNELSVTFFWPFSGDYRVLALADDYRWAVVGSSTMAYLWFLHRAPHATPADWTAMEQAAVHAGYDLSGLIRVEQGELAQP
ncbi:MAG TPA: lipocalin [Planctomycetes bacterium]|nr:lipocalin [Planctomycetota bacterium]